MNTSAWSPFRHRNFALLWGASLVSNIGSWMHDMAASWFMTTLDSTPFMVALVQSASTLPVCLLALPAGTLADRMDRRRLLIVVQVIMLVLAAALGLLAFAGRVAEPMLLAITFGMGLCTAVMSPTWQSIIPRLVPPQDLQPAVALHAVGVNISRAIGPAVGGFIIVAMGIAWPFMINAASFVAVIAALWLWRTPPAAPRGEQPSFLASMREGLAHAAQNQALKNTLVRSVLFYSFGSAYWALLPLIAREQLHGQASMFGVLTGCIGAGAVGGALLLPRLRQRYGLDRVLTMGILGTVASLAGFALFHAPLLGMITALLAGASWIAGLSSLNVAAQLAVPDWVRARGMALYTTALYGCLALGSMLWGQIATRFSLAPTLLLAAGGALAGLLLGQHRRLQASRPS